LRAIFMSYAKHARAGFPDENRRSCRPDLHDAIMLAHPQLRDQAGELAIGSGQTIDPTTIIFSVSTCVTRVCRAVGAWHDGSVSERRG
jgi:hypothetical protein